MIAEFIKMEGLGNDYIYFDCIKNPDLISNPNELAIKLSDRHFGIGGDGVVLMLPHSDVDFEMQMFNADGSEGEMCGNAIRCIGKYVYENNYTKKADISIKTQSGNRDLNLLVDESEKVTNVRVNMGEPILNGSDIPVALAMSEIINEPIQVEGQKFYMTCVSMGNPHCIIFVDKITDDHILEIGPILERHNLFPNRVNVEFAKIKSTDSIEMRVWERGSGETMACGTGAAAVAVAAMLNKHTERDVTVRLKGGDLRIEWANNNHVYMTGPAIVVFRGQIDIS